MDWPTWLLFLQSHGLFSNNAFMEAGIHMVHGTWHPHGVVWANGPKVGPGFLSGAASDGCPARMQHGWYKLKANIANSVVGNI